MANPLQIIEDHLTANSGTLALTYSESPNNPWWTAAIGSRSRKVVSVSGASMAQVLRMLANEMEKK